MTAKPLRADAKRNHEQLIAAARATFAELGADAPLEEVARRAGVGIGTLYRRFATRDDLIAGVLCDANTTLINLADKLGHKPPFEAMATWLEALVEYTLSYRGLTGSITSSFQRDGTELCTACVAIAAAGTKLIERAQAEGELRADTSADDIILGANAAAWAAEQSGDRETARRMLGLLLDGLRATPAKRVARRRT